MAVGAGVGTASGGCAAATLRARLETPGGRRTQRAINIMSMQPGPGGTPLNPCAIQVYSRPTSDLFS